MRDIYADSLHMKMVYSRACHLSPIQINPIVAAQPLVVGLIRLSSSSQEFDNNRTPFRPVHSPSMAPNMSLASVLAILVLSTDSSSDSSRLFAKYYTPPHSNPAAPSNPAPYSTLKEQKAFEKGLLEKTAKQTSDVILYDNKVVVFKMESDVMLYVVGSAEENEILLYNVILALRDTLSLLLKYVSRPLALTRM
jgi:hypothetical protein